MFTTISQDDSPNSLTLNALYQHDDFMSSISTLVDLGCGNGKDLEWWATRTTREDTPKPLNIRCVGVDLVDHLSVAKKYTNITYQKTDFEGTIHPPIGQLFDVLWCYDSFQYAIDPIGTLGRWRDIASEGSMLAIAVPDTMLLRHKQWAFSQLAGCYYHHSMVGLIHMLAINGWNCNTGFFLKKPNNPWTHAIVYKSEHEPLNPKTTTWHQLSEMKLLPESAERSIRSHNYLRQQDLVVPWLDQSLTDMGQI